MFFFNFIWCWHLISVTSTQGPNGHTILCSSCNTVSAQHMPYVPLRTWQMLVLFLCCESQEGFGKKNSWWWWKMMIHDAKATSSLMMILIESFSVMLNSCRVIFSWFVGKLNTSFIFGSVLVMKICFHLSRSHLAYQNDIRLWVPTKWLQR